MATKLHRININLKQEQYKVLHDLCIKLDYPSDAALCLRAVEMFIKSHSTHSVKVYGSPELQALVKRFTRELQPRQYTSPAIKRQQKEAKADNDRLIKRFGWVHKGHGCYKHVKTPKRYKGK